MYALMTAVIIPDVCLNTHSTILKSGIYSDMDRVVRFPGIVLVNQCRMRGYSSSSGPPPYDGFLWVDFPMKVKHVLGKIKFHCNFFFRFIVWNTKAVGNFDPIFI